MHTRTALATAGSLWLLVSASCSETTTNKVFRFSAIPNRDVKQLEAKYAPVAEFLSDQLGIEVQYVHAGDYIASVEKFINDDVQMAWFGGYTGVKARMEVPGSQAIVKGELDARFKSYFIVRKGSPLQKSGSFPMAAAGTRFTFGSMGSTSGRVMPEHFIRQATGKAPEEFFDEINYSGSHTNTIALVKDGSWDLGVVDFTVYDEMVADGRLIPEDCPIVWETPTYTDYQFTVRPELDTRFGPGFTEDLTQALLAMPSEMTGRFLRKKMVRASNSDFHGIRDVASQLKMTR